MTIVLDKVVEDLASKVVNKFVQTIAANMELVSGIGSAIAELTSDIETFNARLVDASKNQDASELQVLRVAVKKFRSVVDEAQDAVAKYIALNTKHEDKCVAKCWDKIPHPSCGNINAHAEEIQSISRKMNKLLQTHEKDLISYMTYKSNDVKDKDKQPLQPPIVEQDVTGFENDVKLLNGRLNARSSDRIVIPIAGMPGTGKTTFATQIFRNTEKLKTFVPTIWVHVSHSFDKNQKYKDMLCDITGRPRGDYSNINEDLLVPRINELLEDKKYFIVLDDIWEEKDWNSLNAVLPNNSLGSRVLVTTRSNNVVDFGEKPHTLQPLGPEVSWEILEKIVFGKDGCRDKDLKSLGEDIAKRCDGLPLSIVIVGGILRKRITKAYWERVSENPLQVINRGDQSFHKVVKLSYDHLPHENLRNCFLYFATFPKGQEIAALKLIRLWIVEGFIPTIDEWGYSLDLEVEAESYLRELVDRNLVMVMKRSADGQIKTCRIHDSLHEFCKTEASKDNLFYIIDGKPGLESNSIHQSRRRLCFHPSSSSTVKIFDLENNNNLCCPFLSCCNKMKKSPYPSGGHVHSLLLCSSQKSDLKQEELIAIPNAFPLLRVLDIESFKLSFQLPNELFSLNLLKYLAVTTNVNRLPEAFKNLCDLQTLVIKTTERTLEIKGGIWNMEKLKHVQTNASMQLPSPPPQKTWQQNNTTGKTNICTLSSISPTSCTKMIFSKTPHLKKLGVRGNLAELLKGDEEICLFNNLQMLKYLENLKLYGQDENASKVPMLDKFDRLRKLTFNKTFFKWDDMKKLGSPVELEVLKLDENAFRGEHWDLTSDVIFNQLRYLRIGRTNLETWTIVENCFPVLENLVLRNCPNLEAIPSAFAQVPNLKVIELYHMSENANNSARQVGEQRRGKEKVKELDIKITPLPPKEKENVNTSRFDLPGPPPTVVKERHSKKTIERFMLETLCPFIRTRKEETNGKENVNTSGFELPSSSSILGPPSSPTLRKMAPMVEEDEVVGFDNEMRIIKDRLFRESMNLTVISIVGMIGVGKTTFVKMLFSDAELQYEFFTRIWVYVSRDCSRRQILYSILNIFTRTSNDDFHKMSDEDLVERIKKYLEGGKYLIVLDDVWTKEDWEQLKIVFPKNQKGSRILVTTRYQNVASHIDSTGIPHELKYLSDDECWELLEKKIFGRERCPTSLEAIGRSIAKKCDGVPLVVGKISGVLSHNRTVAEWRHIESNPFGSIEYEDDEVMREIINYDVMRDSKLKECLLYLAAFPRGSEIDARELMYLWIAEGFILGMDDELEYKAEKYVKDFVQRNLLMVVTRSADDRIKGLRIHGLLHEMYIREAAKPQNNFMREFQVEGEGAYGRGLYLHSSSSSAALALQCISKITDSSSSSSDHVRSFLSFSSQESIEEEIPEEVVAAIPNAFPNLQVLDIRDFKFPSKLPKELYRLQHLTYLGITIIDLKLLPKEFGSLTQLQTLVLHTDDTQNTSSSCVKIEADIWSCMPNLRHLLTTTSGLQLQLPSPIIRRSRFIIGRKKSSSGSGVVSKITTLSTISPTSCTPEILLKTPEIKKLGIRGNLAELMDVNQGGVSLFDNLHKLDDLENLKLINDGPQSNRLRSFPRADRFPRRLRKMTLSNTAFQWKDFSALGSLDKLEVLKLDDNAFRGESCDVRSVVFKQLQYFRIRRTDLVSWTVSKDSFPVLKCLFLIHCTKLVAVPVEFGEIESLKLLELYCTNKRAVNSAQQIHKWKYRNTKKGGFQLSVYPPDPEPIVEQNVTGFEHEERQLNDRLRASSNDRIAIPIVGLPGIGKTTLANQIFRNTEKLKTFVPTIWIHVSQSFDRKQKYIDMLCDITGRARDEYSSIAEDRLGVRIRDLLKDKKYFIVLDDIWEKKDWDSLNAVLPNNSQGSRVLVTTRSSNVVDSDEEPHILKPLEDKVSWEILEKIVFGKDGCLDNELKSLGVKIAKRCNGVPLSIVMVGGILRKSRAQAYWKHVAEYPFQEINRGDQSYHKEVRLSYDHLPHENLRNCFLYFGSFPIGQEIAALKLIRLWIAEEFIPTIDEWRYSLDLEGKAENYLKELVDRNLVMVMKISADGEIKTCRIHDSLHEFCKTEASKNDLFHIIDGEQELDENTISSHHRRLCFHSSSSFDVEDDPSYLFLNSYNKMKKKSSYPSGEHVQSLLVSSSQKSDIDLKQEELIAIPNAFPLLRVLDIESFKLSFQLPNELFSLNFLKYLAITTNVNLLPKAFKNLRELQTLVIKTTTEGTARTEGTVLEINGGIWNMEKLRHVQTKNASMQLPSLSPQQRWRQNNTKKTDIRTLSWISPTSCQKEIFSKTPHLKKLGVRGNLTTLLEENEEICLFNNLQMLKCLENLKLYGQGANALKVPMLEKFAYRLRKLTFCRTSFKWDDMEKLGSLEQLEVLKLDENAFSGDSWDLKSNLVFNQLQYLRIGRTNLKTWTIAKNNFPVLKNLVLRNCARLEAIPSAFAQVRTLKVIELYHMREEAINSARELGGKDLKITPLRPEATVREEQTHGMKNVNTSRFDIPSSSTLRLPPMAHDEGQTHGMENVNTSRFDLPTSSISRPPPTAHEEQTHGMKNVNTSSRFDLSSSSTLQLPPMTHEEQTHGIENVYTSRFDFPRSPTPQSPPRAHEEQTQGMENGNTSRYNLPSSSTPRPPPTLTKIESSNPFPSIDDPIRSDDESSNEGRPIQSDGESDKDGPIRSDDESNNDGPIRPDPMMNQVMTADRSDPMVNQIMIDRSNVMMNQVITDRYDVMRDFI